MLTIQNLKAFMVAVIATFFSLLVFNNIGDYETNHWCVQSVLRMDNVNSLNVMWRAIQTPWLITSAYLFIRAVGQNISPSVMNTGSIMGIARHYQNEGLL